MKQLFLILFLVLTGICQAQTQLEMNQEAADAYREADKEMTAMYKKVSASLDPAAKKLLLQAQREWIRYKEAHCKAVAQAYDKGSMQPMVYSNCLAELTKERTEKLKRYLLEGGLY